MKAAKRKKFLDSIDPALREVAETFVAWVEAELKEVDLESKRRSAANAERIEVLNLRLDHYEQNRLDEVTAKLIEFADAQLPEEERHKLIELLHHAVERIGKLERKVGRPEDDQDDGDGSL